MARVITAKKVKASPDVGFPAGRIRINGAEYMIIVAPKKEGEHPDAPWNGSNDRVKGALSFCDGLANTKAMAKAGSKIAEWALGLSIGGHKDWYIPSLDELEIIYRAFKPTADDNSNWARSGMNLSAVPPTWPYSHDPIVQTKNKLFKAGGAEAFDEAWYWTSTQRAGDSGFAWVQYFGDGIQDNFLKSDDYRVRAVRRLKI